MKKISIVLILIMIFALSSVSIAEGKEGTFKATMTDMRNMTAKEWFSSDINRAEIAVLLSLDCTRVCF